MTRYARSGNTQKHQRMPGNPTPWEDFSKGSNIRGRRDEQKFKGGKVTKKFAGKKKFQNPKKFVNNSEQWRTGRNEMQPSKIHLNEPEVSDDETPVKSGKASFFDLNNARRDSDLIFNAEGEMINTFPEVKKNKRLASEEDGVQVEEKSSKNRMKNKFISEGDSAAQEFEMDFSLQVKVFGKKQKAIRSEKIDSDDACEEQNTDSQSVKKTKRKRMKIKKKQQEGGNSNEETQLENSFDDQTIESLPIKQAKRMKRKKEQKQGDEEPTDDLQNAEESEGEENSGDADVNKNDQSPGDEDSQIENNEKKIVKKIRKNGMPPLPNKATLKIENMRKELTEKGLPNDNIKSIIRKEKKREESKFKKTLGTKICFKCRKVGHILANCPLIVNNPEEGTGICFKCGSTEHGSSICNLEISGHPYAKCFICKERGHIARNCPQNKHGVYPDGGKCDLCGNINHKKRECPVVRLSGPNAEEVFTGHTMTQGTSVDADEITQVKKKIVTKKPKLVKF